MASIKARYRKTWAGFLWVILNPVLMFGVQSLVFKKFLNLTIPNYYLFLLGGLLPWIFITSTVGMGTPVFVSQSQLLKSFKINPWVILASQVLDSFINFMASFTVVMLPFYFYYDKSLSSLAFLPLAMIPLLAGILGLTITLSILNIFYRDINFVMGFVLNLLFYLTPIFYPREMVPENLQWMADYNPLIHLIQPFRTIIYSDDLSGLWESLGLGFLTAAAFLLTATLVWKMKQNEFYRKL